MIRKQQSKQKLGGQRRSERASERERLLGQMPLGEMKSQKPGGGIVPLDVILENTSLNQNKVACWCQNRAIEQIDVNMFLAE